MKPIDIWCRNKSLYVEIMAPKWSRSAAIAPLMEPSSFSGIYLKTLIDGRDYGVRVFVPAGEDVATSVAKKFGANATVKDRVVRIATSAGETWPEGESRREARTELVEARSYVAAKFSGAHERVHDDRGSRIGQEKGDPPGLSEVGDDWAAGNDDSGAEESIPTSEVTGYVGGRGRGLVFDEPKLSPQIRMVSSGAASKSAAAKIVPERTQVPVRERARFDALLARLNAKGTFTSAELLDYMDLAKRYGTERRAATPPLAEVVPVGPAAAASSEVKTTLVVKPPTTESSMEEPDSDTEPIPEAEASQEQSPAAAPQLVAGYSTYLSDQTPNAPPGLHWESQGFKYADGILYESSGTPLGSQLESGALLVLVKDGPAVSAKHRAGAYTYGDHPEAPKGQVWMHDGVPIDEMLSKPGDDEPVYLAAAVQAGHRSRSPGGRHHRSDARSDASVRAIEDALAKLGRGHRSEIFAKMGSKWVSELAATLTRHSRGRGEVAADASAAAFMIGPPLKADSMEAAIVAAFAAEGHLDELRASVTAAAARHRHDAALARLAAMVDAAQAGPISRCHGTRRIGEKAPAVVVTAPPEPFLSHLERYIPIHQASRSRPLFEPDKRYVVFAYGPNAMNSRLPGSADTEAELLDKKRSAGAKEYESAMSVLVRLSVAELPPSFGAVSAAEFFKKLMEVGVPTTSGSNRRVAAMVTASKVKVDSGNKFFVTGDAAGSIEVELRTPKGRAVSKSAPAVVRAWAGHPNVIVVELSELFSEIADK